LNFGAVLKDLRQSQGMTQEQLASALKLSKSTISMYECDQRRPELETLELIADYFNVDMNRLMGPRKNAAGSLAGERELIELYRGMPDAVREELLSFARFKSAAAR